ncbi:MAG: glucosamine-6-phosphate deaminase [Clostridia bacterium]|nr:glucosamine-6-phosphate deaminase [Clostridia bacterium]
MLVNTIKTDSLTTYVYDTRDAMGQAAGKAAAEAINRVLAEKETANVIFAAAPSQNETLEALLKEDVDFSRINAFHMDEYVGLGLADKQSFASYLTEHIFSRANFRSVHLIPATEEAETACKLYTELLTQNPPDVVLMGIGENGHIAFNDPPVADFKDTKVIKIVELDEICRQQQVHDKCFETLEQVPKYALTLTVPTLMSAGALICTVPGPTKAAAVRAMLQGSIGEACPATALRLHNHANMYLDKASAQEVL